MNYKVEYIPFLGNRKLNLQVVETFIEKDISQEEKEKILNKIAQDDARKRFGATAKIMSYGEC